MATQSLSFIRTEPAHLPEASPRKLRVLVVDNSAAFADFICAVLEFENAVEIAGRAYDGAEALRAAARLRPDVTLMDVQMPVMDGVTAARYISSICHGTAVILMSMDDSPRLHAECLASNAIAFIHKPRFGEQFQAALKKLSREESQHGASRSRPPL